MQDAHMPSTGAPPDTRDPFGPDVGKDRDPRVTRAQEEAAKQRNEARQERLVADTDKLLQLAQDLKAEVDKSDKNTLSVGVIKKAEEIEKLAKGVKTRMKSE
jgi:hypothetical protein